MVRAPDDQACGACHDTRWAPRRTKWRDGTASTESDKAEEGHDEDADEDDDEEEGGDDDDNDEDGVENGDSTVGVGTRCSTIASKASSTTSTDTTHTSPAWLPAASLVFCLGIDDIAALSLSTCAATKTFAPCGACTTQSHRSSSLLLSPLLLLLPPPLLLSSPIDLAAAVAVCVGGALLPPRRGKHGRGPSGTTATRRHPIGLNTSKSTSSP